MVGTFAVQAVRTYVQTPGVPSSDPLDEFDRRYEGLWLGLHQPVARAISATITRIHRHYL